QKELLSYMHQNGVDILAGSDFGGMPYVYPGMGLHQELALLCEAGLSNAEALASATINPAIFLSIENKYGSISEGKIADLVLLKMNPLENIENTQAIVSVYRKGVKVKKLLPTMYMR
ncbi:MAG: amidohydrolase family protein, partial [Flavobacteriaceae bacterium]|nr:amidohydrolase family protein [Flavobacteriaceae bacterium]